MTPYGDLYLLLGPLVGFRVYPDTFVQNDGALPIWPAIRYTQVAGTVTPDVCGDGEIEEEDPQIQLDVVAKTADERETLLAGVRTAMKTFDPPAILQGSPFKTYDSETKTFRATMDYVVYPSSEPTIP